MISLFFSSSNLFSLSLTPPPPPGGLSRAWQGCRDKESPHCNHRAPPRGKPGGRGTQGDQRLTALVSPAASAPGSLLRVHRRQNRSHRGIPIWALCLADTEGGINLFLETFAVRVGNTVAVQLLSYVQLFVTPWTAAHQASLSFAISWSLLRFMSVELMIPCNHLILCRPLLLPSIFPSIRSFPMSQLFTSDDQSIRVSASA